MDQAEGPLGTMSRAHVHASLTRHRRRVSAADVRLVSRGGLGWGAEHHAPLTRAPAAPTVRPLRTHAEGCRTSHINTPEV
jgi:hypothetical protein